MSHGWQFLFISWLARVFVATLTSTGYNGSTEREVGTMCIPLRGLKWFIRNKESSKITVANVCVLKIFRLTRGKLKRSTFLNDLSSYLEAVVKDSHHDRGKMTCCWILACKACVSTANWVLRTECLLQNCKHIHPSPDGYVFSFSIDILIAIFPPNFTSLDEV